MVAPVSPPSIDAADAHVIRRAVHRQADAYVAFLSRLVRAESPSTDPDAQIGVQRPLARALRDLGYTLTILPGTRTGGCLYARPSHTPPATPRQLLLGHSDTVWPHGTLARMPVRHTGDRLAGPGVFDMKAGLTSIVFALRTLRRLGHTPAATPLVLVTSDEEIGSQESQHHIERLARCSDRVFVLEPALGLEGRIKTARKGTGEYGVRLFPAAAATPAPSAPPTASASSAMELARLVQRLHALNAPERGTTVNVGTLDGQPHSDGSVGRLAVDVRVQTTADADRIDGVLRSLTASSSAFRLAVDGEMEREPLERTPRNQALWAQARRLGTLLDLDLRDGRAGGGSDGNFTSLHTATLDGLGAVGDGAHADHEFIDIPRTLDRCALLALLLLAPLNAASVEG